MDTVIYVMVNLTCQPAQTRGPRYSVKHQGRCCCKGMSSMKLTFKSLDFENCRLPFITWVGLTQSLKVLKEKRMMSPREEGILLPDCLQTHPSNISSSLGLQPQACPAKFQTCQSPQLHEQIPKISLSPSPPSHKCMYMYPFDFVSLGNSNTIIQNGALGCQEYSISCPGWQVTQMLIPLFQVLFYILLHFTIKKDI